MSTRFFGQFLLDLGEIDEAQLEEAIEAMDQVNLRLGDLAIRRGVLTREQVRHVYQTQRDRDARFGELAVELGLMDRAQLDALLEEQSSTHLDIGQALVRGGAFSSMHLVELRDRFKAQEEQSGGWIVPGPLSGDALSMRLIDLLPRVVLRASLLQCKIGRVGPWMGSNLHPVATSVELQGGERRLVVGLTLDEEMARELTLGMLRCQLSPLAPSDFDDAAGQVAQLLVETATKTLGDPSLTTSGPRIGHPPSGGHAIELLAATGAGTLILFDQP